MTSRLFSPFALRSLELDNRIVVSPMAQYSASDSGVAGNWHLVHIGSFAVSGPGLIIMEAAAVQDCGRITRGCLGLWSDAQIDGLRNLVDFAHTHGSAKVGIQLAHSGRKGSATAPWLGGRELGLDEGGWDIVSASTIPYPAGARRGHWIHPRYTTSRMTMSPRRNARCKPVSICSNCIARMATS